MEFLREYPPLEGGFATKAHFGWAAGLSIGSLDSRVNDGSLPPMPKPFGRAGGKLIYQEYEMQAWAAKISKWKEDAPARRAAERAEAAARQAYLVEQARIKLEQEQRAKAEAIDLMQSNVRDRQEREAARRGVTVAEVQAESDRQARSFDVMRGGAA